jgi:hypothetical protein
MHTQNTERNGNSIKELHRGHPKTNRTKIVFDLFKQFGSLLFDIE